MVDVIITISDLHIPFHHESAFEFLRAIKNRYKKRSCLVINGGDELSWSQLSYHEKETSNPGPEAEFEKAKANIKELYSLFPEMILLESNHGSLVWRKAKTHGFPRSVFKNYNDILDVGKGWKWVPSYKAVTKSGSVYFIHGKLSDVTKLSKSLGMSVVQFHYHEKAKIEYWSNRYGLFFGAQAGCLINDYSAEFHYNKLNPFAPIISTLVIDAGVPILYVMKVDKNNKWIGVL